MEQNILTPIIENEKILKTQEYIDKSTKIVITTHISPDGDALGSSLALYNYLLQKGKNVTLIVPNSYPYFLNWIPGVENVVIFERHRDFALRLFDNAELVFCLDYNIPKRAGIMGNALENCKARKILIDHHLFPGDFVNVSMSYPQISSTSELIFRILWQMNQYENINTSIAECIYCGMMTDTGGFTYNSNDPEIFQIISLLLKKGMDKDDIYNKVYNSYSEDRFRMLRFTLSSRMKTYPELRSALIWLSKEDQKKFNFSKGDTEGFVNYPLRIKGIVFATFIREDNDLVKLSFRSKEDFACNEFATEFYNGGGHKYASGGEFYGTMDDALSIYEKGLQKYADLLRK